MLKVWRCCLLKNKIKYQPSKDLKTFSFVELVFFFESTSQATLHKMRNFEKFSQIIDCGQGKVLHKIAWSIVCIDRWRFQKTLRQIMTTKEFGFCVDMRSMVVTSAKLSISSHLHFPWAKPLVICKSHEHVLKSWASHLETPLQRPKIISKLLCNKLKSFATATLCVWG